jgi:ceramide glucosyltransferase
MLIALLVTICTLAAAAAVASVVRVTGRRIAAACPREPITVLKPLCGADEALEANLETFFGQRHADFELVFGLERDDDPARAVVERLRARHPVVRARVVVHGRRGLNPKVANLRGMLAEGAHDLVVISDSNIAVAPDYLERMAATLAEPGVGLVTSLFTGIGERSLGARLECLQLAGATAGSVAAAEILAGNAVCVGKSMAFRLSVLDGLGGIESVSAILAEDYVLGRMFQEAGLAVRLCPDVIRNVTVDTSVGAFLRRQIRWGLLRSRLVPLLYPFEILTVPFAVAALAMLLGAGPWVLAWGLVVGALRDGAIWLRLRGPAGLARALPLAPLRDLLVVGGWLAAPFNPDVSWRGHRRHVSAGTRVYGRV